jgi:predicted nucleotidyltransferase
MEAMMAQTALDLSPQQWQLYRPGQLVEASDAEQTKRLQRRRQHAWRIARQAAQLLRDQYGAIRVMVFGSLVHDDWFTIWSDIDLAAWGIPPDRFYSAVAAVSGLSPLLRVELVDPAACRPGLRQTLEDEGVEL